MWKIAPFTCVLFSLALQLNGASEDGLAEQGTTGVTGRGSPAFSGRLLVVPMDGSHWANIKAIAQEVGRRGHSVTVLIPEITMRMGPGKHYSTLTYPVPYGRDVIDNILSMHSEIIRTSSKSFMGKITSRFAQVQRIKGVLHANAESLLFNASLISHLQQQGFDAVLTDPFVPTGSLIAWKFGLPTINLLRGIPCSLDMRAEACPSPPSYVPRIFTGFTDQMNFPQRVINTLVSLMEPLLCRLLYWRFDKIAYQFLGENVGIAEVLSNSSIWLLRTDFAFDFPRPLMPNVVLVGGINCHVRNPLDKDLEPWVSGPHGFVVFTLGSTVSTLPEEITEVFLEAFRQIRQKVIWRHTGPVPDKLPENVKMMKWVPQNDLLAHPGVRAFITHSGLNGLYEGLCHGVPMVMMPLHGDQPDNAKRMASRGAGVVLDIFSITVEKLLQGLNEVLNNTRYKDSMRKLSALHKDRPMHPLELSVYWTEFVMRHKGASHLRPAAHDLYWLQYHSLDVLILLATVLLVVVIVTVNCVRLCLRGLRRKRKQD